MSDELRAAAEQFLDGGNRKGTDEFDTAVKNAQLLIECGDKMARYILASHPADDGQAVDAGWLLSVGFSGSNGLYPLTTHAKDFTDGIAVQVVNPRLSVWFVSVGDRFGQIPALKTRGDVRRLCRALGIEVKEASR